MTWKQFALCFLRIITLKIRFWWVVMFIIAYLCICFYIIIHLNFPCIIIFVSIGRTTDFNVLNYMHGHWFIHNYISIDALFAICCSIFARLFHWKWHQSMHLFIRFSNKVSGVIHIFREFCVLNDKYMVLVSKIDKHNWLHIVYIHSVVIFLHICHQMAGMHATRLDLTMTNQSGGWTLTRPLHYCWCIFDTMLKRELGIQLTSEDWMIFISVLIKK